MEGVARSPVIGIFEQETPYTQTAISEQIGDLIGICRSPFGSGNRGGTSDTVRCDSDFDSLFILPESLTQPLLGLAAVCLSHRRRWPP